MNAALKAQGYVYFRGEWWLVAAELPRDMYSLKLGTQTKHVSLRVLLGKDKEEEVSNAA